MHAACEAPIGARAGDRKLKPRLNRGAFKLRAGAIAIFEYFRRPAVQPSRDIAIFLRQAPQGGENGRGSTIGLDLAKQVFQVHGMSKDGKKVFSHKLARAQLTGFFKKQRGCIVAMEATGGAHHWAREIGRLTHSTI
jgi:hypothetical protein